MFGRTGLSESFAQVPQGVDRLLDIFSLLVVGALRTAFRRLEFGLASISLHTELVELSVERVDDSGRGRKHAFRSLFDLPVQLVDVLAQPFGIDGNNLLLRLPSFLKNLPESINRLVAQILPLD